MIFLGIMGDSGIRWEPMKSNDLNPTKGGLYKKVRAKKWGVGFWGKLEREGGRKEIGKGLNTKG